MVCKRYGFEEYSFPVLESFEVFASKTGEEIVNEQLFSFEDKAGRKLAICPELTPSTVRMLAQRYKELPQPIKWFMIGQNWRFEKPQRGRGREFYQLELNIFGIEDVIAEYEIFSAAIDIMKKLGATKDQFKMYYNDRKLISALLNEFLKLNQEKQIKTRRIMDKKSKLSKEEFRKELSQIDLEGKQIEIIEDFMQSSFEKMENIIPLEILEKNKGYKDLKRLRKYLNENNVDTYCEFEPSIIRGFDYSDGLVYEMFDLNPKNNRSMFGGERFDKLIEIFGNFDLPATGFAMGDVTLEEFLKGWNLLPDFSSEIKVFVSIFDESTKDRSFKVTAKLREAGINTYSALEIEKLDKQLKYADRKGIPYVVIIGPDEIKKGRVILKDMKAKSQEELPIEKVIDKLKVL